MEVNGKVALVTGASSGIGRAIAVSLARKGARLLLVARGEEDLEAARKECEAAGSPRAVTLSADVGTSKGLDAIVLAAVREFDGFDILVNNAGIGSKAPIADITDEAFDRMVAVNLRAPYLLTQAAVKVMRRRGGGQVVQIASGLSYHALPGWSAYTATKFALRGFTLAVRQEVSGAGIKVGIVAPGYTETRFFEDWPGDRSFEGALQPEDVAHAAMAMIEQGPASDIAEIRVRNTKSP
jgi:NAD(P)-dependent dehydrogenase (short-subunit alcohol dehydrogenase family)